MQRFLRGLLAAPFAGAAAAFLYIFVATLVTAPAEDQTAVAGAALLGAYAALWTWCVCAVYTVVVGAVTYGCRRAFGLQPSWPAAVVVSLLVGALPFTIWALRTLDPRSNALSFAALATLASVATGWTFWRVVFRPAAP